MQNSTVSSISGLTLRLLVVGIPKHCINPFARLIWQWKTCSGEQWTIDRIKALKTSLIHLRSGLKITIPLARNRKGEIKGVVGYLMKYGQMNDANFVKVINAFMAYTHWTSSSLTSSQRKKFLKAVSAQPRELPEHLKASIQKATRAVIQKRTIVRTPSPLVLYRGSAMKMAPTMYGSVRQSEHLLYELMLVRNDETVKHIKSLWEPIYKWVFKGVDIDRLIDDLHPDVCETGPLIAGEVHFLQEPGYKLRSIASPYRLFQVASQPLKDDLKDLVSKLPWDCTHDQGRAFGPIQEQIKRQKKVHSVDLSSATDLFPYEIQEIVLSTIYGADSPYLQLFREISRANWKSEIGSIKWTKGQPLGFNPSFFCFTLSHGLLLYTLNGGKWDNDFFVVGDDVVILSDVLHQKYIDTLALLECPYSPTKSISSDKLAEFAGKLILSDLVVPQLKWRQVSDDNFIDLARIIGPRIRLILSRQQNKVLDVFAHVSDLVHPYGLNWSYEGSTLDKMIKAGMELTFQDSVLSSLTGLSNTVHKQLYADYGPVTEDLYCLIRKDEIATEIQTFDEKVLAVYRRLGFARVFHEYFLENLKDIPEAHVKLHAEARLLPLETLPPARETLFQRLSKFLGYQR